MIAILGPRQVGKTTLASMFAETVAKPTRYLDLERNSDRARLAEPEIYLGAQGGRLTVLDEIQRLPDLFPLLRSLVDERVRAGERGGQFLILGSASPELLRQSSESLAGRILYLELTPLGLPELWPVDGELATERRWLRGGFPGSYLARTESVSWDWRGAFIATYLERDIPQLGPRLPAERVRRLWSMLAHGQGEMLNLSRLAQGLDVTGKTVRHYLDVLTNLYMVRQLPSWAGNSSKRLIRAPKIYVRDSGLLHRLANIPDQETLLGHPLCGPSWEGFALEQLLNGMTDSWRASYYRSSGQAEVDLILEGPRERVLAIEIKRTLSPKIGRGFRSAAEDVGATERYFVIPQGEPFPMSDDTEAVPLREMIERLSASW